MSPDCDDRVVIDARLAAAFRAVRIRRGWRQEDVAAKAGVSRTTYARAEAGQVDMITLGTLRRIAAVLEIRIDLTPRWRGEELDRLVNARHSAMHEHVAAAVAAIPGWVSFPEVSFAIFGDRGVVDILAWHAASRTAIVIELKTAITDAQAVLGAFDRKRRLALQIARERGLDPVTVGCWLAVADSPTNRRRVNLHHSLFRSALPNDARDLRQWLRQPAGQIAALSFLAPPVATGDRRGFAARRRVRASLGATTRVRMSERGPPLRPESCRGRSAADAATSSRGRRRRRGPGP